MSGGEPVTGAEEPVTGLLAAVVERDVVRVAGPDAVSYLQGQLSQDLDALPVGASARSFLLQPAGKVDAWLRLHRLADDVVLLDVEPGWAAAVVARLQRFKLRVAAEVAVEEGWAVVAVRQAPAGREPRPPIDLPAPLVATEAGWPMVPGYDVLGPRDQLPAAADLPGTPTSVDVERYEGLRVVAGVPAMGAEVTERTIPAELGRWVVDSSASFTKGCYTGQELVARVDARGGNVPRHLRGVVVDAAAPPVGAEVLLDGRSVGTLTTVAAAPAALAGGGAVVALAALGRAVEPPTDVRVVWDGGEASGRALALPLPVEGDQVPSSGGGR